MRGAWRIVLGAVRDHGRDGMAHFAAALAFHLVLSVVPLLALVLLVGGSAAEQALLSGTDAMLGDERGEGLKALVEGAASGTGRVPWGALGVGLFFLFAAGQMFATLGTGLNRIWDVETEPERGWWRVIRKRFLSFAALTGFALLLVVSLAGGALLSALLPAWTWARVLLQALLALAVLAFLYKQAPDAHTRWHDVLPAAGAMAVLLSAGQTLLAGALTAGIEDVYGSIAAVIIAMTWFYYSATLVLFGAELAQETAHARGDAPRPEPIARPRGEKTGGSRGGPRRGRSNS